jgi:hypothetical protein
MAPEDREANLLIAVAAPVNASAVPPLGAAEAGASATACTGSRHCSPRSTLHSPGPHRVSHAPRPSGFLGFLKYSCTDRRLRRTKHPKVKDRLPVRPRFILHAALPTSHHTQSTPLGSIGRGLLRAPDRTNARLGDRLYFSGHLIPDSLDDR